LRSTRGDQVSSGENPSMPVLPGVYVPLVKRPMSDRSIRVA
jgi:hypothetical protein